MSLAAVDQRADLVVAVHRAGDVERDRDFEILRALGGLRNDRHVHFLDADEGDKVQRGVEFDRERERAGVLVGIGDQVSDDRDLGDR